MNGVIAGLLELLGHLGQLRRDVFHQGLELFVRADELVLPQVLAVDGVDLLAYPFRHSLKFAIELL